MNYRRGFFRIWVALSLAWMAGAWWLAQASSGLSCMWEAGPWCDYRMVSDLQTGLVALFAAPAALLAIGLAASWIIAGFRRRRPPA